MIRPLRRFSSEINFIKNRVLQQDLISSQYSASNHSLLPHLYSVPSLKNNILYLLTQHSTRSLFLVDPGDLKAALGAIQQIKFNFSQLYILKTHNHARHCGAIPELVSHFPSSQIIQAKFKNTLKCDQENEKAQGYILLNEVQTITVGDICVSCLYTPGHSADHISFVVTHVTSDSTKIPLLFSGDSLRIGGVATNRDESVFSAYFDSILKMFYLPQQTLVFPGHEDAEENLKFAQYLESENELISGKLESIQQNKKKGYLFSVGSKLVEERLYNPYLKLNQHYYQDLFGKLNESDKFKKLRKLNDRFLTGIGEE